MNDYKLTIVVGTCNRLPMLQRLLTSLRSKLQNTHRIVVVDAGSQDGTIELLHSLKKDILLVSQKKRIGQAKSFNQLLRKIRTKYVCWLSDDNIVRKNMLDTAVAILDADEHIGMVGLKVKDVSGRWAGDPYIGGIWPSGVINVNQGMIRTEVLQKVRFFDERFPDYGMDADLTTKVLLAGYRVVYTKDVVILHHRNYRKFPGAFSDIDRSGRMVVALERYKTKYRILSDRYLKKKMLYIELLSTALRELLSHLYGFRRFGFSMERFLGYVSRDFINVFEAQFVSKLDLWYNRKKPYYLVQEIPTKFRRLYGFDHEQEKTKTRH